MINMTIPEGPNIANHICKRVLQDLGLVIKVKKR